jgi:hypothetical protein
MSTRTATWLAWALAGLTLTMFVASVALLVLARSANEPSSWGTSTVGDVALFMSFLVFPFIGALIAYKRPGNPIGWICLADGLLWALIVLSEDYSAYGLAIPGSVPFPVTMVVGARRGAARGLPASAVPGRAVTVQEVAPPGLALWGGDRVGERHRIRYSWASGGARGARNPFGLEGHPWVADAGWVILPCCPFACSPRR